MVTELIDIDKMFDFFTFILMRIIEKELIAIGKYNQQQDYLAVWFRINNY